MAGWAVATSHDYAIFPTGTTGANACFRASSFVTLIFAHIAASFGVAYGAIIIVVGDIFASVIVVKIAHETCAAFIAAGAFFTNFIAL